MKRMDDRGFSLVELIIVIAIMAVLMGILAPQFLRHMETSREQKDRSVFGEIERSARIACNLREVYDALPEGDTVVTIKNGEQVASDVEELTAELRRTMPDTIYFVSKKYKNAGDQTLVINVDIDKQLFLFTNSWDSVP